MCFHKVCVCVDSRYWLRLSLLLGFFCTTDSNVLKSNSINKNASVSCCIVDHRVWILVIKGSDFWWNRQPTTCLFLAHKQCFADFYTSFFGKIRWSMWLHNSSDKDKNRKGLWRRRQQRIKHVLPPSFDDKYLSLKSTCGGNLSPWYYVAAQT